MEKATERLTSIERDRMRHALGISAKNPKPYRNHYAAGPADVPIWDRLVERGFATRHQVPHVPGPVYCVTFSGRTALAQETDG